MGRGRTRDQGPLALTRKLFRAGTHRVAAPAATLARLEPKLARIGVTRVANVTGLDYIGLPVVTSTRPGALSLSVQQGKGLTLEVAKVSAIMESIESFSAQRQLPNTFAPVEALEPERCLVPRQLLRRPLPRDIAIPWLQGRDMRSGRPVLVPEELVKTDCSWPLPQGHGWFLASSNGLAAGNTHAEAQLHAICELIERDAFALWSHAPDAVQTESAIDPDSLVDPTVAALVCLYQSARLAVELWDITSDIAVPAFLCVIDDHAARPPYLGRFGGVGCHPSVEVALSRAMTEAAQSRLTFIVGSRDDVLPERYTAIGWRHNIASLLARHGAAAPKRAAAVRAQACDSDFVETDLETVLARLARSGVAIVISVDLTDPELDVPCTRVIIPDLEGMHDNPGYTPGPRARTYMRPWS